MKAVITLDKADMEKAVRMFLAAGGMNAERSEIKLTKTGAVVTVDIDPMEIPDPAPASPQLAVTPPPVPDLHAIEGGAGSADMTDIFNASKHLAATTQGKFPPRTELMDGESYDPPGENR